MCFPKHMALSSDLRLKDQEEPRQRGGMTELSSGPKLHVG